jgi:ribosomal protein S18 acetylase RimI-like enzyme
MVVRELEWADFTALVENYLALYDEVVEDADVGISLFPKRPSWGEEAEWFGRLYRRVLEGTSVAAVAEEQGTAVGLCTVDQRQPTVETQHVGVVGLLVAKPWRGQGIGKSLLRQVIEQSRGTFEILTLSVFLSNTHARGLYRSVGFKAWGVLPGGILRAGHRTDLEFMSLELAPVAPP